MATTPFDIATMMNWLFPIIFLVLFVSIIGVLAKSVKEAV